MIESKEQWKYIRGWGVRGGHGHRLSADDRAATIETLEALRAVARAFPEDWVLITIEKLDRLMELEDGAYNPNHYGQLRKYLDAWRALPSWLLEED